MRNGQLKRLVHLLPPYLGISNPTMAVKKTKKKAKVKRQRFGWKKEASGFVYKFTPSVAKRFSIKKINFSGFSNRPMGLSLYEKGTGFNFRQSNKIGGNHFLDYFKAKYNKTLNLTVFDSGGGAKTFKVQKKVVSLGIPFKDFTEILRDLGDEIKEKKGQVVEKRLSKYFPTEKEFQQEEIEKNSANAKLNDINLNNLEKDDHEAVARFIKSYISLNSDNDRVLENIQTELVIEGRKKTLDQVVKKFEKHLKNKNFDEKKWQKFLHTEVFYFLSNYVESIREADVNFGKEENGAKKPDFVWIDTYGFLDVFEIKTPFTEILAKRIDKSHDNYFLSRNSSMAISQIEKYILFLESNVKGFEGYLAKKTKVPFSVLRPKAFLIIGDSREYNGNDNKKRDFRVLRRSFKNIEFITFDELLDNLKSLSSKFEKITRQ
jgi:hypothetical protein